MYIVVHYYTTALRNSEIGIYDRNHLLLEELKIMKNMCLSFGAYLKPI